VIEAAKGGLWSRVIGAYVGHKVRQAFRGVWVRGALPSSEGGLVVYANHTSFWDGFLLHQLSLAAGWDAYAVMEEQNLARYPFHARLGAFSVRRGDPASALATVRYAKRLLQRPKAAVCIFPEGVLHPGGGPPAPLERGVELLARAAKVRAVPLAIRYAFLDHEYPDILLEVGTPHPAGELAVYTRELRACWERVSTARDTSGFSLIVRGRRSVQERWDAVRRLEPSRLPATAGQGRT
jgi:1-acyl-sn-glycerol-3-phosphate acyltransferase